MKYNIQKSNKLFFLIAILLVFQVACQKEEQSTEPAPVIQERGEISSFVQLGIYTPDDILQIINSTIEDFPFELKHSVKVYSVQYYTVDCNDILRLASGAIAIPDGIQNLPLMSIQHGTETMKHMVASVNPSNSTEGMAILIAGSMGYYAITSDYLGFGVSDIPHPYMHAESLVPSVIDFIRVSRSFADTKHVDLDGKLFLTGYSEGGYASLAAQKVIEEQYPDEFSLAGVAPMSGPYDLSGMIENVFTSNNYPLSAYFAYFFNAYDGIYSWNRLDELFKEPYASSLSVLFDGTKSWGTVISQLPAPVNELFREAFILDYLEGYEPEIALAIKENTLLGWKPVSPIHFIHGDADQLVPLYHALNAMDSFTSNGATQISLTTIQGGTHASAGPEALTTALNWIESMRD